MKLNNVHQRLKKIQTELNGSDDFSKETMARLEKLSKEIKPIAVEIFGEEDEITGEIESAILLSKDYDLKINDSEKECVKGAMIHFQYGIALFLDRIGAFD